MNTLKLLSAVFTVAFMASSCGQRTKGVLASQQGDARLEVSTRVDMGDFEGPLYKKFTNIIFRNTGTDTLYIISVAPMCECTEVVVKDSVVAPGCTGILEAYLDLSGYPATTTEKEFSIWSNNADAKEVFVTLVGTKK